MVFACPFERRLELTHVLTDAGIQMRPFSFTTRGVHAWGVEEQGYETPFSLAVGQESLF